MYGYNDIAADANLVTTKWTKLIFIGSLKHQGRVGVSDIAETPTLSAPLTGASYPFTVLAEMTLGVLHINPLGGGIAQFKGLTVGSTTDLLYVEMICRGIQPVFAKTAWKDLKGTVAGSEDNGWVFTCLTGISQCGVSVADWETALSKEETMSCVADPRYQTWRMVTAKYTYIGTKSWARTDSYWNAADDRPRSTWGPSIKLSSNFASTDDNNGAAPATDNGKTYVYAFADGSGVQLVHLTFDTNRVTTYATTGAGSNNLTAAPTSFTNSGSGQYVNNVCATANLLLAGTADTTGLTSTVTDWSDGYRATMSIGLEFFNGGARGGWRGACVVLYAARYIQDSTNGAVCVVAQQSSAAAAGPFDFGAVTLMHVPNTVWAPPARSAAVTPSGSALTDAKLGITASPAAAVASIYTEGNYASSAWYQPKAATVYAKLRRYGKNDFMGAYCISGGAATSYFAAPAAGMFQLTGSASLAASAMVLVAAFYATI